MRVRVRVRVRVRLRVRARLPLLVRARLRFPLRPLGSCLLVHMVCRMRLGSGKNFHGRTVVAGGDLPRKQARLQPRDLTLGFSLGHGA
jgi:hypothetical protein